MSNSPDKNDTHAVFNAGYSEALEAYKAEGAEVISSYKGVLSPEEVNNIAYDVEGRLTELGEKKGVIKRIFSIIIETLQNIRLHGEKDSSGSQNSFMIIAKRGEEYIISTCNLIYDDNVERVKGKIEHINRLDRQGLKEYYMDTLTDGKISSKGGAGLGFITIGMKSKNPMDYGFKAAGDGLNLFYLDSKVTAN